MNYHNLLNNMEYDLMILNSELFYLENTITDFFQSCKKITMEVYDYKLLFRLWMAETIHFRKYGYERNICYIEDDLLTVLEYGDFPTFLLTFYVWNFMANIEKYEDTTYREAESLCYKNKNGGSKILSYLNKYKKYIRKARRKIYIKNGLDDPNIDDIHLNYQLGNNTDTDDKYYFIENKVRNKMRKDLSKIGIYIDEYEFIFQRKSIIIYGWTEFWNKGLLTKRNINIFHDLLLLDKKSKINNSDLLEKKIRIMSQIETYIDILNSDTLITSKWMFYPTKIREIYYLLLLICDIPKELLWYIVYIGFIL